MAFLDDMIDRLEAQGVGTDGTDLFPSSFPSHHDVPVVKLVETGGFPNPDTGRSDKRRPTFQAMVRGIPWGYQAARQLIEDVFNAFDRPTNLTINGTRYTLIDPLQTGPADLGYDEQNRPLLSINFVATREG